MQKGSAQLPDILQIFRLYYTAKTPAGLQAQLDIASKWANDRQMTWNIKKGKSEILQSRATKNQTFVLSGKPLSEVADVLEFIRSDGHQNV